jgi:hypothetical protein
MMIVITKPGPALVPTLAAGAISLDSTGGEGEDLWRKPLASSSDNKASCYFNHSHPLLENIATAAGFASGSAMVDK